MRVLGVDPGLLRSGWALIEPRGGRAMVAAHGLIRPVQHAELPVRLADGAAQLRRVVTEQQPDLVVLEEVFTAPRHPRSALLMAHMRGVICLVVAEAGLPLLPLTATTVKQRITGNGHASKLQVQRMILRLTGLHAETPLLADITDAMALGVAGVQQMVHAPDDARTADGARLSPLWKPAMATAPDRAARAARFEQLITQATASQQMRRRRV